MTNTGLETSSPLYAVIDLGSNSFHMLITRQLADSVQVVDKIKRKVRLAAGLNKDNILSQQSIAKGLECLSFFAERLQDIPKDNIRIVATATLRIAKNSSEFLTQAEHVLAHKINLLSGLAEAKNIYLGVAHTSCSDDQRLVLDIGGASTEIIVGDGFSVKKAMSLDLGCVTFNQQYFSNGDLNKQNFSSAIVAAERKIAPFVNEYKELGWQCVLGGSGTMQALAEILMHNYQPAVISLAFMNEIRALLETFDGIEDVKIPGLTRERSPVIASGLSILIALFQQLSIKQLQLSNGALREGILYEMLPHSRTKKIRQRTISALAERFHTDKQHAHRIKQQVMFIHQKAQAPWQLKLDNAFQILLASCDLHEVGLLLEYKKHQQHSAYILKNADLAGFSQADRELLVLFALLYKGAVTKPLLSQQSVTSSQQATYLLVILRLAIILCGRRKNNALPDYEITVSENNIALNLPNDWLAAHPLIADELSLEIELLAPLNIALSVASSPI